MPGRKIELRHVRYVIAAAEHGSFREAGKALCVEQSAISRRIRDIEDIIGAKLFRRHHGGVELTDIGRQFLEQAREGMIQIGSAVKHASAIAREGGVLRIGFFVPLAMGFMAELLRAFRADRPKVQIEFVEAGPAQLMAALRRGEIDVGFVTLTPPTEGFELVHLWTEALFIVLAENDPLAERTILTWHDLADCPFVVTEMAPGDDVATIIEKEIGALGRTPSIERHAVTRESLLQIVANGGGITLVGGGLAGVGWPGVVFRRVDEEALPLSAAYRSGTTNAALRHFMDLATNLSQRPASWFAQFELIPPGAPLPAPAHPVSAPSESLGPSP